ncbi:MAG: MarR family winged helix-turn-helix transcriptional regulator [Oscillospiraceae bacterium]|jgi:DNA-binding MarR family transcriptional regulator|nr:MarR family winged helix-turn-helix transcriptional regulator [Oscillospiraceae bacterium]
MKDTLEEAFNEVYLKFKLQFYKKIFSRFEEREASLTAVETFCAEAINALHEPTIKEFADFVNISPENAAYKVQNLIKKGYVTKVRSETDRREYHLCLTARFYEYLSMSTDYIGIVLSRMQGRFSEAETEVFERILRVMSTELMPEIS